ncbi:MAG: hypothetical protein Q9167_007568 [Letrouitia subvulpina]
MADAALRGACERQLVSTKRPKCTGRAFYERMGSPKMVLAPMVDQSEFAWRTLTRSYLPTESSRRLIAYSPMFHARLFKERQNFRDHCFQPLRSGLETAVQHGPNPSNAYLDGNPSIDRPLFVQFCANSPDDLWEAARYVAPFCDAIDLNLGCPQGIARKGFYGAFLQEHWDLVYKLVNILHQNSDIPVTAKMRILETKEKTLEYAKVILSAGASIITVHGRQRDQKGHKTGLADWSVIRYLRENLPRDTVIFANGNILRHIDIGKCLEETGADAVMSAEGNLHDPTIFAQPPHPSEQTREYWQGRDGKGGYRIDAVFRRYVDIIYRFVLETDPPHRDPLYLPSDLLTSTEPGTPSNLHHPSPPQDNQPPTKKQKRSKNDTKNNSKAPRTTSPNLLAMQAHLFRLLRPLISKHTAIRDALARCRAGDMPAFETVLQMTETAIKQGLQDYELDPSKYDDNEELKEVDASKDESSVATVRECRRPWWVCQPHVRPLLKEALEKGSLQLSKKEKKKLQAEKEMEEERREREREEQENGRPVVIEKDEASSEREQRDRADDVPVTEMPKESMVCG